ncbi:U32 family peptidase [Desulfobacula toluolica]|uniref:Putative peptidase, U32 family n=1 Tax=Desulfobacula toluolica (strain DSM 7467 / Tol2) TaxID=651182 RepID=K0NDE4_DESTT|nr:U32 family peptidase [Desulfobacula toluolica]CCK78805.1 putative peptidase, U32 family [Desulfobacula toluolica Tol2]
MKIITPISNVSELDMLLHNGADELYCGLRTPEWDEIFGQGLWMNRRSPQQANLSSWEDLEKITTAAHNNSVKVSITLNASFYPEKGIACILKLCDRIVNQACVDALIVSDLNLLIALSKEKLPVRIHLSSLGSCFNSHSIDFYRSLGVDRIILPRQLTLPEIKSIVQANADKMEFEVFALNDGCYFEEGFCQTSHTLGAFCLTDWEIEASSSLKTGPLKVGSLKTGSFKKNRSFSKNLDYCMTHYKEFLWFQNNCGSSFQKDGLPNGPCSLCGFGHFRDWGVTAVKIVGREASFHRKMGSLQLVKAVRDKTRNHTQNDRIKDYARDLRQTPEYCDSGYMCYFREA